jgi:hypothetical protein
LISQANEKKKGQESEKEESSDEAQLKRESESFLLLRLL